LVKLTVHNIRLETMHLSAAGSDMSDESCLYREYNCIIIYSVELEF